MRNATLIAALLLSACATPADDAGIPSNDKQIETNGGKADGHSCDFTTLQGLEDAFGYSPIAHDDGTYSYRIGTTWNSYLVLDNGNEVDLTMYLLDNGRVVMDYSELSRIDAGSAEVVNETFVVTHALLASDGSVRLANLAIGTPGQVNTTGDCRAGLTLEFRTDIHSAGFTGKHATIYMGSSSRWVIDPDHLEDIPNEEGRAYYQQQIASGAIKVLHL